MPNFIQLVEDDLIPFTFTDPDTGEKFETTFLLRVVPDEVEKRIRKKHTVTKFRRGNPVETVDWRAYGNECLAFAIQGWKDLKGVRLGPKGEVLSRTEIPFDTGTLATIITRLPETLKGAISRVVIAKQGGELFGRDDDDDAGDADSTDVDSKS